MSIPNAAAAIGAILCVVIVSPVGGARYCIGQGWNRDDFSLVKTGEGCVDQNFRRHHASGGQIADRAACDVPELGGRRPGQHRLDARTRCRVGPSEFAIKLRGLETFA
jgi:hypothetical protein